MIYAVIDTNVLVSALITHNSLSATAKVVSLLLDGGFTPLYDSSIIEEYQEVLHRTKFKLVPGVADALISYITEHGIETSRTPFPDMMPDEDDRVFYEVSLSADDSFLVTGNLKHYPQTPKVISPADFIRIVMEMQEE
jgi:putative PIN family toxin of toxin-antitoxin system